MRKRGSPPFPVQEVGDFTKSAPNAAQYEPRLYAIVREPIVLCDFPGGIAAVVPPSSIPNLEVKRCRADGSASKGCARVGRRQVFLQDPHPPFGGAGLVFRCPPAVRVL